MTDKEFDWIILGSGAAGSICAYFLSRGGDTVALLDIGVIRSSSSRHRLTPPYLSACSSSYTPAFSGVFGGNTNLWSGKIYLISEQETEQWPIPHEELLAYSTSLADALNLNHENIYRIDPIDSRAFYHRSARTNLGNLFETLNLEFNPLIACFEGATVIDAHFDDTTKRISHVDVLTNQGDQSLSVRKGILLCAGGLGNLPPLARLLDSCPWVNLASNVYPLSDHRHFTVGAINPLNLDRVAKGYLREDDPGYEDCLVVSKPGLPFAFQVDGAKSIFFRLKKMSFRRKNRRVQNAVRYLEAIIRLASWGLSRLCLKQRLQYSGSLSVFSADPVNNNSTVRVVWSETRDRNSLPRLQVNYAPGPLDTSGVIADLMKYSNNNAVNLDPRQFNDKDVYVGLHPSCSTPLRIYPQVGEIGIDLNVKGIQNLFVVGSNVFPTNGVTNPTWTIMVLAYRLAMSLQNGDTD